MVGKCSTLLYRYVMYVYLIIREGYLNNVHVFTLLAGFNPVWNEPLNFIIHNPELALVRFVVEDYDKASRNDFIGQYTLPFTCIQAGEQSIRARHWSHQDYSSLHSSHSDKAVLSSPVFTISSLSPGYRHIHLLSKDGTAIPPSSIFINISISELT